MAYEHTSKQHQQDTSDVDVKTNWLNWCRLCAKIELSDEERSSIFVKNEAGRLGSELATSIGKYFWVNIKPEDKISLCVCLQCKQLLQELVEFTERVNTVQTLFCLLQNIKPKTLEEALGLRMQCGLIDEGWQHIVYQQMDTPIPNKPLLIDKLVQTDELIDLQNELANDENSQEEYNKNKIINMLQNTNDNEICEDQADEAQQVYEYVMQRENDKEYMESGEYVAPSSNEINVETKLTTTTEANEDREEMQDVLHEFKEEDDENVHKAVDTYQIIGNGEELEFENSSQQLQEGDDDDDEQSIEILEDEDDLEFINTNNNPSAEKMQALPLLKGKRGRPHGVKNSNVYKYRFECKDCKRTYKNPTVYRKHMIDLHGINVDSLTEFESNCNTCSLCDKKFTTRSSLKMHMRHHLPDEEKFSVPCPYCDRKFSQVGAMRQHVNGIHHQMKPFICDQCGRACKTMAALNEHLLVHTNECPFECEVCHKRFKNKPRLKTHMDTHNKSVYKCEDCGLELNTRRTLLQHRLVHSDVKRFKCEFCDAAFKRSKALKNHLILHSGLRPYKCNFCNKSFSNGSNCRAHKKRTHPQELAEEEATGKEPERVPIPKIEELKSAKSAVVQPRKMKRHVDGLPNHLLKLLKSEKGNSECQDYEATTENFEGVSDCHYEIYKAEIEDTTDSMADHPNEECEETVIYEIIDEI